MDSDREQRTPTVHVLAWAGLAAMVPIGVAAALVGHSILVWLSLPVVVYLMIARPYLGLLALVVTIPLEYVYTVGEDVTGTRVLGNVVAIAWLVGKLLRRESFFQLVSTRFFWVASLFLGLVLISSLWSAVPAQAYLGFVQLVRLLALTVIAVDLLDSDARVRWLIRVLVFGALAAGLLTIEQYLEGGVARAGVGIMGVNNVVLVTLLPFAFFVVLWEEKRFWRAIGGLYIPITVAAVSMTFSRMNFLLLPVVLLAMVWPTLRTRRGRRSLTGIAVGIVLVAALFIPWERVEQRMETVAPYLSSTLGSGTHDSPVSGRGYHFRVAVAVFKDHPLLGVGYNHYGYHFVNEYQYSVRGSRKVYNKWRSPHSSHLGILADLGVVGIVTWGGMLSLILTGLMRAKRHLEARADSRLWFLVYAVTWSSVLLALPYGFWADVQKSKLFWLIIALAIVVIRMTEFHAAAAVDGTRWRSYPR